MLTLIFICAIISTIISFRKWEKTNFKSENAGVVFVIIIFVLVINCACLGPTIGMMLEDAEAQEKVIILQQDIENLKAEEKDIDKFVTEYDNLKQQLEDAQNYIEQHKEHIEKGCSVMKFLLYFGK